MGPSWHGDDAATWAVYVLMFKKGSEPGRLNVAEVPLADVPIAPVDRFKM
jgi:hypothetical protein